MDIKQIKELMAAMEKGGLRRLRIKDKEGFEVELEKESPEAHTALFLPASSPAHAHHAPMQTIAHQPPAAEPAKKESSGKTVNAPLVGTFYASASPGEPAFVRPGDLVDENSVVCIIEAMKVMNEVKAGIKGKIAEVLVDNAQPVEFGTPLYRIV